MTKSTWQRTRRYKLYTQINLMCEFYNNAMSSFWISIAGRSPKYLISRLINTVRFAIIFGEGTGANLIFVSSCWPLWETRESMVDCMFVVIKIPPLFKSRLPGKNQSSLVCVVRKISSCDGFDSVLFFCLKLMLVEVWFSWCPPQWGAPRVFHPRHCYERVKEELRHCTM